MRDPNAGAQLPGPLRHCQYCSSAMGTGTDGTWQVAAAPRGGELAEKPPTGDSTAVTLPGAPALVTRRVIRIHASSAALKLGACAASLERGPRLLLCPVPDWCKLGVTGLVEAQRPGSGLSQGETIVGWICSIHGLCHCCGNITSMGTSPRWGCHRDGDIGVMGTSV